MEFQMISALVVMGGLGLIFGTGLAIASKFFMVHKDPQVEKIEEVLPGLNCCVCGAPGCDGFAAGVVEGKYSVSGCVVGGTPIAQQVAAIMGTEIEDIVPQVAVVRCSGDRESSVDRAVYSGIQDCRAAVLVGNGPKGCVYGCLGMGTCERACPFEAIRMGDHGLPLVDEALCTGCGKCVEACPRNIMELIPRNQRVYIACVSKDSGNAVKEVCKVGCIGCGLCATVKITPDKMIVMDGKLPVIHYERIQNPMKDLENAVAKCPTHSFGVRQENIDANLLYERKTEKVAE
jgi:electron transport complex protein RnfB